MVLNLEMQRKYKNKAEEKPNSPNIGVKVRSYGYIVN